jgi:hypothetical protein
MNGIWSPSQDIIKSQVTEAQQKPTLFGSEFVQEFINRTKDSEQRSSLLGQAMALEVKMSHLQEQEAINEVEQLELELEQLAEQGKVADAKLLQLESQTTSWLNAQLARDAALQRASNMVANLRGNRPGTFASRRDIADHEAKLQGAAAVAAEAEQDVIAHAGDYHKHLREIAKQKSVVQQLAGRDKAIRRRLALLQGKPAPDSSTSGYSASETGLGGAL